MSPVGLDPERSERDEEASLILPRSDAGRCGQVSGSRKPLAIASCLGGMGFVLAAASVAWTRSSPGSRTPLVVAATADAVQLAVKSSQCKATFDTGEDCGESGQTQAECEAKGCCYDDSNDNHWCWSPDVGADDLWECRLDKSDQDCGHETITREECEAKGCCYDETAWMWCYPKTRVEGAGQNQDVKYTNNTCDKNGKLTDCGEVGITQKQCEDKGCCYDETSILWCFQKTASTAIPATSHIDSTNEVDEGAHDQEHIWKDGDNADGKEPTKEVHGNAINTSSDTAFPSLFCFSILAGAGEDKLVKIQEKTGTGIYGCDEWGKFTSNSAVGHEGEPALPSWTLTKAFIAAWKLLKVDGRYKKHDYIVKLDADTVFFPDRLRSWLGRNEPPQDDVYIQSCLDSPNGLASSLQVFSQAAVDKYLQEIESCQEKLEYSRWGEEKFTQECMNRSGVLAWTSVGLVCDKECSCDPSPCGSGKIGYHSFNETDTYEQCIEDALRVKRA